jgi:hypothetical protein
MPQFQAPGSSFKRMTDGRWIAIAVLLAGAAITLAYRPLSQSIRGDCGIYDYIAQSILRGEVPYRDVIDPKTPGAMYLSAAVMAIGRSIGLQDVIAVRWLYVLLAGLLSAVTFLTAEAYLRNRIAAVIACVVPFVPENLALMMTKGTQPKLPMMIFGMLALLMIAKDRPFLAGLFSMLSTLCWQPGLMFTGVAFLMFSRYLTSWRDRRATKVIAGAALPLCLVLLYFYWRGALGDYWSWTITYTFSVFAPQEKKSVVKALAQLWNISRRELGADLVLAALSLVGYLMWLANRLKAKFKDRLRSSDLFRDAILLPPAVYFIFCTIDFQGGPDLIPFIPFVGVFAGWFLIEAGSLIASNRSIRRNTMMIEWRYVPPIVALSVMLMLILARTARYRPPVSDLQEQERAIDQISKHLGPNDSVYEHGVAEILVLLNRPNANRYIAMDSGADDYIAAQKPGGFKDVIDELESAAPKIVVISRLRNVNHGKELEQWADEHYDQMESPVYERVYVRKR